MKAGKLKLIRNQSQTLTLCTEKPMARSALLILIFTALSTVQNLKAQIDVYGQVSPAFTQSSDITPQLTINAGRPTFLWRLDVLADAYITDNVTAYINLRSYQDQIINIDYLAIRISDISPLGFNIQAGKFDMPFGNLYSRRFPADNFLFDLPLIYQYHTVVMSEYIFQDAQELLQYRGSGGSGTLPSSLPILDRGIYGTGVMLFGSIGIVDYFAAIMNGTVSNTGSYGNGLNMNDNLGKLFRISVTPFLGLTIGGAFNWGSYLSQNIDGYLPYDSSAEDYQQYTGSFDIEYSRGHLQFFSQAVYNSWDHPNVDEALNVFGYYAETKYTFRPRWYVAARLNQLLFSDISVDNTEYRWDHNVFQIEGGLGYALDRNTLAKLVYQETIVYGTERISNSMFSLQLVASF